MFADSGLTWDLIDDLRQLLEFHFMQNAFAAGTIVGVLGGVMGYFVVLRRQSFATHALSQVGFPGAAGAALVGIAPIWGLVFFCLLAAFGIGVLGSGGGGSRRGENAAIGSILVFSLALGLLFARLYSGFVQATYSFLFGTFLGINDTQLLTLLAITVACLVALAVIGRPLLFASLQPDVAASRGVPEAGLSYGFLVLVGLAVASTAVITGTLLVFALIVTPAATARELTARPLLGLALSAGLAVLVTWLGLSMAYFSVYPLGFYVTTLSFGAYVAARVLRLYVPATFLRRPPLTVQAEMP
jgi:zinc/manganese transport system permease protein